MMSTGYQVTSTTDTATGGKAYARGALIRVHNFRPATRIVKGEADGSMVRSDAEAVFSGQVRRGDTVELVDNDISHGAPVSIYYQILEARSYTMICEVLLKEVA